VKRAGRRRWSGSVVRLGWPRAMSGSDVKLAGRGRWSGSDVRLGWPRAVERQRCEVGLAEGGERRRCADWLVDADRRLLLRLTGAQSATGLQLRLAESYATDSEASALIEHLIALYPACYHPILRLTNQMRYLTSKRSLNSAFPVHCVFYSRTCLPNSESAYVNSVDASLFAGSTWLPDLRPYAIRVDRRMPATARYEAPQPSSGRIRSRGDSPHPSADAR